jgi:hydroxymethylpyrimidine pyrophosphatase-like HAD family hydrolase
MCGIGVAMGNATEELKEASDYVTTGINEDGIWNALKHFELI